MAFCVWGPRYHVAARLYGDCEARRFGQPE